ncbi:hypothetical protein KM427_04670 [Nocardioides sp. LMS-CY]|uniref:hypothetical protein n=1 Tax=Nocardioides sp. (strain LMS-CY) TaxID=2840457 RepID=UPI001C005DBA|nr:hypothetical protein [Nocardioides sp. LMS-CY]QWF23030.1 hypothetical protein KM427_04670 [Nocardioides sp. LMS-CY]
MNSIERLRPEIRPLDAEWSASTLEAILAGPTVADRRAVPPRRSRARLILVAAATVAVAGLVVVVVPGLGTTAAYSVQEGNSGTITVEVRRLEDAEGLEAELAEHGVTADITYLPDRQTCAPGRYVPVARRLPGLGVTMGSDLLRVTLPPGSVRAGETFVMAVSGEAIPPQSEPDDDGITTRGGFAGWTDFNVTAGPVRSCEPVGAG